MAIRAEAAKEARRRVAAATPREPLVPRARTTMQLDAKPAGGVRGRWPFLVAAVLVLGLGAVGGALAQRLYRAAPEDDEAFESDDEVNDEGTTTAADLPSRQPPVDQGGDPLDRFFNPKPDPRPPAANGGAPSTPRPKPGRRGGGSGVTGAPAVEQFGAQLATQLCEKLTACGLLDLGLGLGLPGGGGASGGQLCDMAASALQDPEAAERVRRGECQYDSAAASKCLSALDSLSCDGMDPDGLLALADSMDSCTTAFRCD